MTFWFGISRHGMTWALCGANEMIGGIVAAFEVRRQFVITPKVLASSSPGLSLGNPGITSAMVAETMKGFVSIVIQHFLANPFRVV